MSLMPINQDTATALRREGIELASQLLESMAGAYANDYLVVDPDTNAVEGSEQAIDYWNTLLELAEKIRTDINPSKGQSCATSQDCQQPSRTATKQSGPRLL